ncbi:MAG: hypothetical protein KZQ91_01230 [Candidatus Thiodiazotropha sp. (ex Lucinoma borealis)]|nr:hypothetical protein [Candidatus Thiodiazotropha sp. (ex Lucinoma borealis)]
MSVNKAAWEDISDYAEVICNVRAFGVDLEWARRAWGILQDTPLCEYSNSQEFNSIVIRLFCLGEIIHIYNYISMDESYEPYEAYCEWLDEIGIQKIELVVLAGEEYYSDSYIEEYGEISEVISHLMEMQYNMVVEWLIKGFGGKDNMIALLESPLEKVEDSSSHEDAIAAGMSLDDIHFSEETIKLYQWKESDFTRNYA